MRIVFLVHQYPPERQSGTEIYTHRLALAMMSRGHDVHVLTVSHDHSITYFGHQDDRHEGVLVRRLFHAPRIAPNPFLYETYNPALKPYVAAALAEWRPDVVHVTHASFLSASAIVAASEAAPVVLTLTDYWLLCPTIQLVRHDGSLCRGPEPGVCQRCMAEDRYAAYFGALPAEPPPSYWGLPERDRAPLHQLADDSPASWHAAIEARPGIMRQVFRRVFLAISPSRFLRDLLVENGFTETPCRVLPHGIDPSEVGAPRPPGRGPFRFGYVGSLSPRKGVHVLIDAMRRLGHEVQASLSIHGGGQTDPPYYEQLRRQAEGDPRVSFAGEFGRRELGSVFSTIDALVVPSLWYENAPLVVREALVNRIPVIASDLGGLRESLENGGGLLVPHGDSGALASAMARIACEEGLSERLVAASPRVPTFVEEVDAIEGIYGEVAAARAAATAS